MVENLKIRYWDDPVLSTLCDAVEDNEFGPKLDEFAASLLLTMDDRSGIGLAAPQVGVTKRIFAMRFPDDEEDSRKWSATGLPTREVRKPIVVCNPVLESSGPIIYGREGCLSLPSIFEQVGRPQKAVLRYFRPDGTETELKLTDLNARVAFHEADHLLGIMFFDRRRVSRQVNRAVERAWGKIKHGYV